jgi:creatine kinase
MGAGASVPEVDMIGIEEAQAYAGRNFYPAKWEALVAASGTDGKVPKDMFMEEAKKIEFPKGQGAGHGPWKDDTFCATDDEIHAPKYFEKGWEEFGEALVANKNLSLPTIMTKEMYEKYAGEKTALGVTLDKCIKGGVDRALIEKDGKEKWNCGKVGVLFGDAECVTKFSEIMDPIILERHGLPADFAGHPAPNLDPEKLLPFDEIDDNYVISTRIRTGRSIKGFALPPSISADQRAELEKIVVGALKGLTGDLEGDYYPLAGSCTYPPKPNGIDKETEEGLIKDHFLFQAPDEPMLLSWRMERDWPQARGIYHNAAKNALVWVNEEDHLRIISMQKGKDVKAVFTRFADLVKAVQAACVSAGKDLEISEKWGNVLSCPSNCGTGLRASMMIKIPLASKKEGFAAWCAGKKLQARGSGGFASDAADDGIRDVSNVDRMGKDEVTLVNEMIAGIITLVAYEKKLESEPDAPLP